MGRTYNVRRMGLAYPQSAVHLSPLVLLTLLAILAASLWIFATLARRETVQRRRLALRQWAWRRGLRLIHPAQSPDALALPPVLAQFHPRIEQLIRGGATTITRVDIAGASKPLGPGSARWNLFFRRLDVRWPTTGLRPAIHTASIIDLFSLASFPSLTPSGRFMLFGTTARAAAALAQSPARTLLPADVGLLFSDDYLILDFTTRPFDEIEFGRMIDLAEQIKKRCEGVKV